MRRSISPLALAALAALAGCGDARPLAARTADAQECSGCHFSSAELAAIAPGAAERSLAAHATHAGADGIAGAIGCAECHPVPEAIDAPGHRDGTVDVVFSERAGAGARWDGAQHGCAVSCHGDATPIWTKVDGSFAACGSCHGIPPTANGHTTSTACGSCHDGYSATAANPTLHQNGRIDVLPPTASCGSCHAIPPRTGQHTKHVGGEGISCGQCHAGATTSAGGPGHMNGTVDVSAPGWNAGTGSCANSCHGSERWQ